MNKVLKTGIEFPVVIPFNMSRGKTNADFELNEELYGMKGLDFILKNVNHDVLVPVIDVYRQNDERKFSIYDYINYFKSTHENIGQRQTVYNLLSFEFSGTGLDFQVKRPKIVRQLDWVNHAWPCQIDYRTPTSKDVAGLTTNPHGRHHRFINTQEFKMYSKIQERSSESDCDSNNGGKSKNKRKSKNTNKNKNANKNRKTKKGGFDGGNTRVAFKYDVSCPNIQKYCLISCANSFTNWHTDFGGTSVYYHVTMGEKWFYLMAPTSLNLEMFYQWQKLQLHQSCWFPTYIKYKMEFINSFVRQGRNSVNQSLIKFRDDNPLDFKVFCVVAKMKDTLILPAGWIHCVYTPIDSMAIGGNYLHDLSIDLQIDCHMMDTRLEMDDKHRAPYFEDLHAFALVQIMANLDTMNDDNDNNNNDNHDTNDDKSSNSNDENDIKKKTRKNLKKRQNERLSDFRCRQYACLVYTLIRWNELHHENTLTERRFQPYKMFESNYGYNMELIVNQFFYQMRNVDLFWIYFRQYVVSGGIENLKMYCWINDNDNNNNNNNENNTGENTMNNIENNGANSHLNETNETKTTNKTQDKDECNYDIGIDDDDECSLWRDVRSLLKRKLNVKDLDEVRPIEIEKKLKQGGYSKTESGLTMFNDYWIDKHIFFKRKHLHDQHARQVYQVLAHNFANGINTDTKSVTFNDAAARSLS